MVQVPEEHRKSLLNQWRLQMSLGGNQGTRYWILESQDLWYQNGQFSVNYQLRVYFLFYLVSQDAYNKEANFDHQLLIIKLKIEFLNHSIDVLLIFEIGLPRHFLDQAQNEIDHKCEHAVNVLSDPQKQPRSFCLQIFGFKILA